MQERIKCLFISFYFIQPDFFALDCKINLIMVNVFIFSFLSCFFFLSQHIESSNLYVCTGVEISCFRNGKAMNIKTLNGELDSNWQSNKEKSTWNRDEVKGTPI